MLEVKKCDFFQEINVKYFFLVINTVIANIYQFYFIRINKAENNSMRIIYSKTPKPVKMSEFMFFYTQMLSKLRFSH